MHHYPDLGRTGLRAQPTSLEAQRHKQACSPQNQGLGPPCLQPGLGVLLFHPRRPHWKGTARAGDREVWDRRGQAASAGHQCGACDGRCDLPPGLGVFVVKWG